MKLQYQRNFGTSAFLRVYGYTYYSDWLQTGPPVADSSFLGFVPSDYELASHTRGLSGSSPTSSRSQHLLSVQGSYTTASTAARQQHADVQRGVRAEQRQPCAPSSGGLVDSSNPVQRHLLQPGRTRR